MGRGLSGGFLPRDAYAAHMHSAVLLWSGVGLSKAGIVLKRLNKWN